MKNICSLCGKPYDYQVSVRIYPDGRKECWHDGQLVSSSLKFSGYEKKVEDNLPKGQFLVKGKDGICRVCQK